MIISLPAGHELAKHLEKLCEELRALKRKEAPSDHDVQLLRALQVSETVHGSRSASYRFEPGSADNDAAIAAYRYLRQHHSPLLEMLCMAASHGMEVLTVEIGTMARVDRIYHSQHDLVRILPHVLAFFRGFSSISPKP